MIQLQVTVPKLNVRNTPEINDENYIGYLTEGTLFFAETALTGNEYKNTKTWYRDHHNRFYWGGGVRVISDDQVAVSAPLAKVIEYPPHPFNWNENFFGVPKDLAAFRGKGIKVAVLDDGIDTDHDDLKGSFNSLIDVTDTQVNDAHINTHGTAVAGIIAAHSNAAKGIIGVAPETTIIPIRIYRRSDHPVDYLISGIKKAVQSGAQIINISYSFDFSSEANQLLESVSNQGIIIVASAGDQKELIQLTFPAKNPSVISVGAGTSKVITNNKNGIDPSLNFIGGFVERWICSTRDKKFYTTEIGSSFCCAYITGLAALVLSKKQAQGQSIRHSKQQILEELEPFATEYTDNRFLSEQHFAFDSFTRIKQLA